MTQAAAGRGWFRTLLLALSAFTSHWRRHKLQLAALLVGLAAATALWSGVQALNSEARRAYDEAAALVGGESASTLVSPSGGRFPVALFAELRRAGWKVSPILEGRIALATGASLRVLGVEPLSAPMGAGFTGQIAENAAAASPKALAEAADFLRPPWRGYLAPSLMTQLEISDGDRLTLADGGLSPPLFAGGRTPPGVLVTEIAAAEAMLGAHGVLDRLLLDAAAPAPDVPLEQVLRGRLTLERAAENDFARLTDSFHLNLTAFGFLAFVVGLFIAHAAIGLAFEQRRATLRTVRALGVSARMAAAALLLETLLLALLAGAAGLLLGYLIAAALAPGVAATLSGLYGAPVSGGLRFDPFWALSGLAMSVLGALAASGQSLWSALRAPLLSGVGAEAWRSVQTRWLRVQGLIGLGFLVLAAVLAALSAVSVRLGLLPGFAMLAALLLGAALALPAVLIGVLAIGRRFAKGPVSRWFWSDARRETSGLALALAALLLALSANIGVGAMVGGFRDAFETWLNARLTADIYVRAQSDAQAAEARRWATTRGDVTAVLRRWDAQIRLEGQPVELMGFDDHPVFRENWTFLQSGPAPWDRVAAGRAVLVSEQLARRLRLKVGDRIALPTADGAWTPEVAAIYADYGNPLGQVSLAGAELEGRISAVEMRAFALRAAPGASAELLQALEARFGSSRLQAIEQNDLKVFARSAFERTFAVTGALNVLTFLVAGVALFASLASLSGKRLAQLAPLWALGLPRRRLAALDLAQTLALALATALVAVPIGMALAWALVAVVNVEAFGWRLPLKAYPLDWLRLSALALLAALLAAAPGYWRLRRSPPERLLRLLAEER